MNPGSALPPSRAAALAVLEQTLPVSGKPGQDLQAALDYTLRRLEDPRDRSLATELCYGFLRHKLRLERLVRAHLSKPERTHPYVLRVAALAAHELLNLQGVPPHATLSWAVDAVKAALDQPRANLANAVLRSIQSLGADAFSRDFFDRTCRSETEALAVWHSCPDWLVTLWMRDYGRETAQRLLEAQSLPPLTGLRVNIRRDGHDHLQAELSSRPGFVADKGPWLAYLPGRGPSPSELSGLEAGGALSRQSIAVGDILERLGFARWPVPVWDACAGRGGKTTALLENGLVPVLASDPSLKRLRGLVTEAARLGLGQPYVLRADAAAPPFATGLGTVLVDAPCSGLGVLSRRPDAKWKRTPADVSNLATVQARILEACAGLPRPGGLLVYMTCTMTRAENDRQAERIESLGFRLKALAEPDLTGGLREFMWGGVWEKR